MNYELGARDTSHTRQTFLLTLWHIKYSLGTPGSPVVRTLNFTAGAWVQIQVKNENPSSQEAWQKKV